MQTKSLAQIPYFLPLIYCACSNLLSVTKLWSIDSRWHYNYNSTVIYYLWLNCDLQSVDDTITIIVKLFSQSNHLIVSNVFSYLSNLHIVGICFQFLCYKKLTCVKYIYTWNSPRAVNPPSSSMCHKARSSSSFSHSNKEVLILLS